MNLAISTFTFTLNTRSSTALKLSALSSFSRLQVSLSRITKCQNKTQITVRARRGLCVCGPSTNESRPSPDVWTPNQRPTSINPLASLTSSHPLHPPRVRPLLATQEQAPIHGLTAMMPHRVSSTVTSECKCTPTVRTSVERSQESACCCMSGKLEVNDVQTWRAWLAWHKHIRYLDSVDARRPGSLGAWLT